MNEMTVRINAETVSMQFKICETCGAVLALPMGFFHEQWHQNIATVAIENTRRIQELEASYGDR